LGFPESEDYLDDEHDGMGGPVAVAREGLKFGEGIR
jgi:hypothetical protein